MRTVPPKNASGAMSAPMTPQCVSQASCFVPNPGVYGRLWATIPVPIIAAIDAPNAWRMDDKKVTTNRNLALDKFCNEYNVNVIFIKALFY